jgi:hypothetical protein
MILVPTMAVLPMVQGWFIWVFFRQLRVVFLVLFVLLVVLWLWLRFLFLLILLSGLLVLWLL